MTIPQPSVRRPGSGTVFGVVIGLFLGVLIGDLALPKHQSTVNSTGPGFALGASGSVTSNGVTSSGAGGSGVASSAGNASSAPAGSAAGSGTGGASATGAAVTGSGGGSTGTGVGGVAPGAVSSRGVNPTLIKIGVAYPDISALKTLGPEYDNGNVPQQWQALVDGWHRQGLLPVNGRDIQLDFQSYNVLDLSAQRSACASLIQDKGVFAVVGVAYFAVGSDCVAREFHTPLLTSDGPGADVFQQGWPYVFSLDASADRTLDNMVYWADAHGLLRGKKIGLYYGNDGIQPQLMSRSIKPTLARLGYTIAAEATTNDTNGGPEDAVAVQRFRAAGVDLAILTTSKTGFLQAANAQQYKPAFIDSDYEYGTSDTAADPYPAGEWAGTPALTTTHRGEAAAGIALSAAQEACLQNYERFSGKKVTRPGTGGHESAEFAYILMSCDEGGVLLDGIRNGGRALTVSSLVAGLEGIRDLSLLRWSRITFGPTRHDGAEQGRTVVWEARCTCWVARGQFSPLPLQ